MCAVNIKTFYKILFKNKNKKLTNLQCFLDEPIAFAIVSLYKYCKIVEHFKQAEINRKCSRECCEKFCSPLRELIIFSQ